MNDTQDSHIFGVILAAGASKRFASGPKLDALFEGRSLLRRACDAVVGSSLDEAIVVLGADADRLCRHCDAAGLEWTINHQYASGQSSSLRCGLNAAPEAAAGCLFVAADQPLLSAHHIDQVIDAARSIDKVVRAVAEQANANRPTKGTPVYFPRRYFARLERTLGDEGGRQVLRDLPSDAVVAVALPAEALVDIDSEEDLGRLSAASNAASNAHGNVGPLR